MAAIPCSRAFTWATHLILTELSELDSVITPVWQLKKKKNKGCGLSNQLKVT